MERMDNMVSHLKMQQFTFITIYINATLYDLEKISRLYNQVLFLVIAGKDGRDGVNGDARLILLNITCNKGCRVWVTMIECQNVFASIHCCALCAGQNIRDYEWYKVQTHVLKVHSVHSIHSLLKSKRLATYNYMQRMRDNNLEIRIAGFSCHPWLSLVYTNTNMSIYTCHLSLQVKLMHEIFVLLWQEFLKTSQLVKQFSEDFQTLPKNVWSCSDNLWAILKLFQVSKGNWIEFLSLIMC